MISRDIEIISSHGYKLAATIDLPDNNNAENYLIFSHCFTCSKELKAISNIHSVLVNYNFGCVRFDYTGIGESEGNFTDSNFTIYIKDLISVADYLQKNFKAPSVLIGHSLGGSVVLEAANKIDSVGSVVVIGTPAEPSGLSLKLSKVKDNAEKKGSATMDIGGINYTFNKQFFDDIESYNVLNSINNLNKPLLILHSPADTYTEIDNASRIFKAAKHPKSFISLDEMDHLMLNKQDAEWVGELIAAWLKRYIK
jgi:putative redox protein